MLTPAVCQHTLPIFDGSHRFDAALSFKRMDNVTATAGYQGPAVVCAMTYRPLAGYRPGGFRVDYLQKNRDMEMWFAPIAGTRVVAVVRISVPTTFGTAVLAATRFEAATGGRNRFDLSRVDRVGRSMIPKSCRLFGQDHAPKSTRRERDAILFNRIVL